MSGGADWRLTVGGGVRLAGRHDGPDSEPVSGPGGRPADAQAIVLGHGLASTHRWWDLVTARLATRHRVVRVDHRGHGRSSAPPSGYTVTQVAADTIDMLDHLGLARVVLAGHSLGAAVALSVAATRPDLVAAVACVDGGVYDPRAMFGATWEQARPRMVHDRRGRTTMAVLRAWQAAAGLPPEASPAVAANYTACPGGLRLRLDPVHEHELARSLWTLDPQPLLAAVRAPVLIVAAHHDDERHDRPRRASIRRAADLLDGRLDTVWVPGGHDLPLQQPAAVARAIAGLAALARSFV